MPAPDRTVKRKAREAVAQVLPPTVDVQPSGDRVLVNGQPLRVEWIGDGWLADVRTVLESDERPDIVVAVSMSPAPDELWPTRTSAGSTRRGRRRSPSARSSCRRAVVRSNETRGSPTDAGGSRRHGSDPVRREADGRRHPAGDGTVQRELHECAALPDGAGLADRRCSARSGLWPEDCGLQPPPSLLRVRRRRRRSSAGRSGGRHVAGPRSRPGDDRGALGYPRTGLGVHWRGRSLGAGAPPDLCRQRRCLRRRRHNRGTGGSGIRSRSRTHRRRSPESASLSDRRVPHAERAAARAQCRPVAASVRGPSPDRRPG